MPDLGALTLEIFSERLGEPFRVHPPTGPPIEVELAEVGKLGDAPAPGIRAPFSIEFTGPADQILHQAIYRIDNDALGSVEVFLVPLQPDARGARYEAVFT